MEIFSTVNLCKDSFVNFTVLPKQFLSRKGLGKSVNLADLTLHVCSFLGQWNVICFGDKKA